MHVHRAGGGNRDFGTRAVYPHDNGRAAAYRLASAVLLVSGDGYGRTYSFLLRIQGEGDDSGHYGGDYGRTPDSEL